MHKADQIFRRGHILTMDSSGTVAESLAVKNGRILALGRERDILALTGAHTQVYDLGGKTVLPGFIDGHSHMAKAGVMYATQLDLSSPPFGTIRTMDELTGVLRAKALATPRGEWIVGFGFDDTQLAEHRALCVRDLDSACPDHPVCIRHVSGHLCACNSPALARADIRSNTPDPIGGRIRRQEDGRPDGILEETAMALVHRHIPEPDEDDWIRGIQLASYLYAAKGITTAQEGWASATGLAMLRKAHALTPSALKIRVQILPSVTHANLAAFPVTSSGTPLTDDYMLSLGAAKHYADGSIQCYTGYLSNPYHTPKIDMPDDDLWRGYPIEPRHELIERVVDWHRKGWQIAIHADGDDAIQNILDAYEEAQQRYPRADARHIIIHCQTVREDQLDRIKRLGVVPSFFVVDTYFWGDRHHDVTLGPSRAKRISPLRSAVSREIPFSTHNGTFVTPIDPLLCVWSAVNRQTRSNRTLGENQRISVMDALRSVTSWAAYQSCEEQVKGTLEPGKFADMVVLEQDPLFCPPEYIKDIGIGATVLAGKPVYGVIDG